MSRKLSTTIKIGVTLIGLAYVLTRIDLSSLSHILLQVEIGWMLAGFGLVLLGFAIRSLRWLILLRGLGVKIRFSRLLELYFVGAFYNALLPSGFGGDVVRVIEAAQDAPAEVAAGTVFIDRLSGLLALFFMALLALPFRPEHFPDTLALQIGLLCLLGLAGGALLLEGSLFHRLSRWLPGPLIDLGEGIITKVLAAVHECGWRAIFGAFSISILFNLCLIGWWTLGARALNLPITFGYQLLVVPILAIALLIPSIGGLGVREVLAPTLFSGIAPTAAVALTLLVFAIERLASLLGAPVYIFSLLRNRRAQTSATAPAPGSTTTSPQQPQT